MVGKRFVGGLGYHCVCRGIGHCESVCDPPCLPHLDQDLGVRALTIAQVTWLVADSVALRFFVLFVGVMSCFYSIWDIIDVSGRCVCITCCLCILMGI